MQREKYIVVANETYTSFNFISEGPKGDIKKILLYQHWGGNIYNFAFGDMEKETMRLNDTSRSKNGDRDKVLATVAHTVFSFLKYHPGAEIILRGSSQARTRLYQMQLILYLQEISSMFILRGAINGNWITFKKGKNYESFSIRYRKNSRFGY